MKPRFIGLISMLLALPAWGESPRVYNVMLLDGQNNHKWQETTPRIKAALVSTGRFKVTVVTAPAAKAPREEWEKFKPDYSQYDAVVSNFTDWGAKPGANGPWVDDLIKYVSDGGGYVAIHAASFEAHSQNLRLKGLGWQPPAGGDRIYVDEAGQTVRIPRGQGPGTNHGKPYSWQVRMVAAKHPIAAGLPEKWLHATDELWVSVRGPAEGIEVIAASLAEPTKVYEPVMWTLPLGKGRVFVTLLGHDAGAMNCVGFRTTLARGVEWTIAGKVTIPPPAEFPQADKSVVIDPKSEAAAK